MRVAVLASGSGSNLQALLDACVPPARAAVVLVVSNRADAGAVTRAVDASVATHHLVNPDDDRELLAALDAARVDLVVLAGYVKLVPPTVVEAYSGRMINIHPALLPAFGGHGMYGLAVHRAVLDSGATVTGPTVHLVTADYDRGPILAQWPVPVHADDTPESLRDRVLKVEHRLLPAVVLAAAETGHPVRLPSHAAGFVTGDAPDTLGAPARVTHPPDH